MSGSKEKSGCLSVIFPFLSGRKSEISFSKGSEPEPLPYRLRDDFLSPAEFSFYKVLSSIASPRWMIQSKVRLADIFFIARPNENLSHFNRIAQKHLDFLVCDARTMKPLLGVELDDTSHARRDRQERDDFLKSACEAAGLPLLQLPAQREYRSSEIAAQIASMLPEEIHSAAPPLPDPPAQTSAAPLCPKCGIPLVLRQVIRGPHQGKQFYGCQNYPHCREMKPVSA